MRTALVAGSTGLVGGHLVRLLGQDARWERVVSLSRRSVGVEAPGLEERLIDFERLEEIGEIECQEVFCALGTTLKRAGSRHAFRRVDLDYVASLARATRSGGAEQFLLVSSIGADAGSRNFYLSVKGQAEAAVRGAGFASVRIFRPSLLMGDRLDARPVERLALWGSRLATPLMRGPFARYRAVRAEEVAAAMVSAARAPVPGVSVHTFAEIRALAS